MKKLSTRSTITVHVPMKFAIRGGRKAVIFDAVAPTPQRRTMNALLKALANAHRWRNQIETGQFSSITELAADRKINQSYACRLLRLTLLSPAIVMDILNGQQRSALTLKQTAKPQSLVWAEQEASLRP